LLHSLTGYRFLPVALFGWGWLIRRGWDVALGKPL